MPLYFMGEDNVPEEGKMDVVEVVALPAHMITRGIWRVGEYLMERHKIPPIPRKSLGSRRTRGW